MPLDYASTGATHNSAVTGADGHITMADNFGIAWVIADVDVHVTVDGSAADQTAMYIKAGERLAIAVQPEQGVDTPLTNGGGSVHFIKHTGAADGNIWITEVC